MERFAGYYALLQYSAVPERQEFLNFGVFLAVPGLDFAQFIVAENSSRISRFFDGVPKARFDSIKRGFGNRLLIEYRRRRSIDGMMELSRQLANEFRISEPLPIAVEDARSDLEKLFKELVGDDSVPIRKKRIATRLRDAFIDSRVVQYLDESPAPVDIPEARVTISAPFGYQNGAYNLIDGVRISGNASDDMKEVGRRAIEGGLLWKHFENRPNKKRLVVVGDFSNHDHQFYDAVGELLEENHVRLYRMDSLKPLLEDIADNASLHG